MKESGLNYFHWALGLSSGTFGVFYTFEEGAGVQLNSISGGQSQFSGVLGSAASFWGSPGSGFFSGGGAQVANASGLDSTSWTKIFVFEKTSVNPVVLFDSLSSTSGHRIGLTHANKPYLETINTQPMVAASSNDYSSKNAVTFSYLPNYLTIGYFNFNSKTVEAETFGLPFEMVRSDNQRLCPSFTGWMDYYLHFTEYMSPQVQGQLLSGLFARPTGTGFLVSTSCVAGITGTVNVFVGLTGITGYSITPSGDEGQGYYTGWFPLGHGDSPLTGYLSSGFFPSGLTGTVCYTTTGAAGVLYEFLTGYAASFGMEKVNLFAYVEPTDLVKSAVGYVPFSDRYNKVPTAGYSGYLVAPGYDTGILDIFFNGVAQGTTGWALLNSYLFVSGAANSDAVTFDLASGDKKSYAVTGTGFVFSYSGQELYLNGVNLASGRDFVAGAGFISLTNAQTGVSGYLFEYPVVLAATTGAYSLWTGLRFSRNTSAVYLNGVCQLKDQEYTEGAVFDLLSGNSFNPLSCAIVYDDNGNYWE